MMDDTDFYGVGLLNDQTHSFNYVIEMLVKLCGVTPEQGLSMAREIDRNGKAIVFSGTRGECENMLRLVSEYGPDPLLPNSNGPIAGYIERNAKPNNVTKQAGNQVGVILALLCFVVPIGAFFAVGIFVGRSKESVEPVNQPGPSAVGLDELRKKPVTISKDEIGDLLTKWWEEGTAAGNVGDYYDNRDDEHSDFKTDEFPQLRRILYSSDDVKNRRNWALTLNVRPHVTFGNSSTAAPADKRVWQQWAQCLLHARRDRSARSAVQWKQCLHLSSVWRSRSEKQRVRLRRRGSLPNQHSLPAHFAGGVLVRSAIYASRLRHPCGVPPGGEAETSSMVCSCLPCK